MISNPTQNQESWQFESPSSVNNNDNPQAMLDFELWKNGAGNTIIPDNTCLLKEDSNNSNDLNMFDMNHGSQLLTDDVFGQAHQSGDVSGMMSQPYPSSTELRQKRKEQNRVAQRAFRERKERYIKELESRISHMEQSHNSNSAKVKKENNDLRALVKQMEAEIHTLKGAAMAFDVSINRLRDAGLDLPSFSAMNEMSPPISDHQSPSDRSTTSSSHPKDSPSDHRTPPRSGEESDSQDEDRPHEGSRNEEHGNFAERDTTLLADHAVNREAPAEPDLVPCENIWDIISEHPNFEDADVSVLCDEVKRKAKMTDKGLAISQSDLQEVSKMLDA